MTGETIFIWGWIARGKMNRSVVANSAPASIYVPLYARFVFVSCVWDRPSSVGGEKSAVLWTGPAGENNPASNQNAWKCLYSSSLSECGRVGGVYLHHKCLHCNLSSFYRVFNVFVCQRLFQIYNVSSIKFRMLVKRCLVM